MRFDEFVKQHGITVSPVDRFDGLAVDVEGPPSWELHNSGVGIRVWVCTTDPRINKFCANAVLTTHRVQASLDSNEVFSMLAEQQVQSMPGSHELHRELAAAADGPGVAAVLEMQIGHELGTLDSVSRSRIITAEKETLIAQLTVTALHDSPVDRSSIWLSIRTDHTVQADGATGPTSAPGHSGAPVNTSRVAR